MVHDTSTHTIATLDSLTDTGKPIIKEIVDGVYFKFRRARWKHYRIFIENISPIISSYSTDDNQLSVADAVPLATNPDLLRYQFTLLQSLVSEPDLTSVTLEDLDNWNVEILQGARRAVMEVIMEELGSQLVSTDEDDTEEEKEKSIVEPLHHPTSTSAKVAAI